MTSYYEILGVSENASHIEIKSAYRAKAKQHHPDLGGSEDAIKQVNLAWEVLSDPIKRQVYDQQQPRPRHWNSSSTAQTSSWRNWHQSTTRSQSQDRYTDRRSGSKNNSGEADNASYKSIGKTTFREICTCGCRGYPFTHLAWKIDMQKYDTCPARSLRKRCGFYYNDSGAYVSWTPKRTYHWKVKREYYVDPKVAREQRRAEDNERNKRRREAVKAQRQREEAVRVKNGSEPLSPAEARRRGLKFYRGKPCKYGHDSLRDLKSNCLRCRELEKLKKASEKMSK